jgi:hypothetical protein
MKNKQFMQIFPSLRFKSYKISQKKMISKTIKLNRKIKLISKMKITNKMEYFKKMIISKLKISINKNKAIKR